MPPYQRLYKFFSIVWGFLLLLNIYIYLGLVIGSSVGHVPKIMWHLLSLWIIVSVIGFIVSGLTIKGSSIVKGYKSRLFVIVIMVLFSLGPILPWLFKGQIISYINSWEESHCTQIGQNGTNPPWPIIKCDNGDTVEKSPIPGDMRRFGDGGIKNMHYPYDFFL